MTVVIPIHLDASMVGASRERARHYTWGRCVDRLMRAMRMVAS